MLVNGFLTKVSGVLASYWIIEPVLLSTFEFSFTRCAYKSNATLSIVWVVVSSLSLAMVVGSTISGTCGIDSVITGAICAISLARISFTLPNSLSNPRDFDWLLSPRLNDWLSTNSKLGRLILIRFVVSSTLLMICTLGVIALRGGNRVLTGKRSSLVSSTTGIDWRPLPRETGNSFWSFWGGAAVVLLS